MFYVVYVIQSKSTNSLYVGYTKDFKRRLSEHNRGFARYTRHRGPWKAIFLECYLHPIDAQRREQYLKTSQGMRFIKRMLKEYFYAAAH